MTHDNGMDLSPSWQELKAELEELRAFKAKQQAAEEAKNQAARERLEKVQTDLSDATRVPPEFLGADMASRPDATVTQEVADQDVAFYVTVEWSGYSRGHSLYRVMAATAAEAMERWAEGEMIERAVVRDDTEKEPVSAAQEEDS